jgi:hypothetical protein
VDSKKVFYIEKIIIRIIAGTKGEVFCRELFKKYYSSTSQQIIALIFIIPLARKLLSLLSFLKENMEKFQTASNINIISTRYRYGVMLMFQILALVSVRKGFTVLELSYSVIFHLI